MMKLSKEQKLEILTLAKSTYIQGEHEGSYGVCEHIAFAGKEITGEPMSFWDLKEILKLNKFSYQDAKEFCERHELQINDIDPDKMNDFWWEKKTQKPEYYI